MSIEDPTKASSAESVTPPKTKESVVEVRPQRSAESNAAEQGGVSLRDKAAVLQGNSRAIKLLKLIETGDLPAEGVADEKEILGSLSKLRMTRPTLDDVKHDLYDAIDREITVGEQGLDKSETERLVEAKKEQYKKEAAESVLEALRPVYEKFGSIPSPENKSRIVGDLNAVLNDITIQVERGGAGTIDENTEKRVIETLKAAGDQELTQDDANKILEINRVINRSLTGRRDQARVAERGAAVKKIREKSGLALADMKDEIMGKTRERKPIDDIEDFKKFAVRHEAHITELIKSGKLSDFIYFSFYHVDEDNKRYEAGSADFDKMRTGYEAAIRQIYPKLHRESRALNKESDLEMGGDAYWAGAFINEGQNKLKEPVGRFYVDINPEKLPQFFDEFIARARTEKLNLEVKIPRIVSDDESAEEKFNRYDKMVVYFPQSQDAAVLSIFESLHGRYEKDFLEERPRFTAGLKNSKGATMQGIGFGQEPRMKGSSFGDTRSKLFAEVWQDAEKQGLSISDPKFDFNGSMEKSCRTYGVDSQNFAFNAAQGSDAAAFNELRKRTIS
jgi:hypothetical protein